MLGHTERGAWTQAGRGACGHYDEVANGPSTCLHTVVRAYVRSINLTGQSDDAMAKPSDLAGRSRMKWYQVQQSALTLSD